jgi:integrase/recombinase XerD
VNNEELVKGFYEDCRLRKFSTARQYSQIASSFCRWLEGKNSDVNSVSKPLLKEYLIYLREDRKLRHDSIKHIFSHLNTLYDYMEDEGLTKTNPIPAFRRRYLSSYKNEDTPQRRKIITIEDASMLVASTLETRDRSIILMLLKTGIRRSALCSLDVNDVELQELTVTLKPTAKRSNRVVFFDHETAEALFKWLSTRKLRAGADDFALFLSNQGRRISKNQVDRIVTKHAMRVGLHDPKSKKLEDQFTPHCCRHWFTTMLIRAEMPRDFIKELRGDKRGEAMDVYNHIDKKELRESYLAHIPQLGI